ncbi:hypothetical protein Csa_022651 [Cucumis sativus]|uniref:Peptidase, M48 family n=1 Tax=Cucumis sativus TaxID=3659 RepID=A0A0A0LQP9_CUCSA|nr:hypothetical protein Csa_022651 [Cucumis sativus]
MSFHLLLHHRSPTHNNDIVAVVSRASPSSPLSLIPSFQQAEGCSTSKTARNSESFVSQSNQSSLRKPPHLRHIPSSKLI